MTRNPLMPHMLWQLDPHTAAMLEALEAAYRTLLTTAEQLREADQHEKAVVLEVLGELLVDRTDEIGEELLGEGGYLEFRRGEMEPGLDEQLAAVWHDYLLWQAGGEESSVRGKWVFGTEDTFAPVLRSIAEAYPRFRPETTDAQLLAAASAAYDAKLELLGRRGG